LGEGPLVAGDVVIELRAFLAVEEPAERSALVTQPCEPLLGRFAHLLGAFAVGRGAAFLGDEQAEASQRFCSASASASGK
jgi:hypothetical protein